MAIQSYEILAEEYLLSDHVLPYTSVLFGILACKSVYHVNHLLSGAYFKGYNGLSRMKRIEWNNRAISTLHAIFITAMSLYLVFWSKLYSDYADKEHKSIVTMRSSLLSTFTLGVSVGYFLADLGMIIWLYPALGGLEYVIHHLLSLTSVAYAMLTGEGQLYTYIVLISETTTPGINLRWYLDTAGMKRTKTYMINGVVIFIAWLVARILLFMFLFYHLYLHYEMVIPTLQAKQMHVFAQFLAFGVPPMLSVMNLIWFGKIVRGLKKTLAKRQ